MNTARPFTLALNEVRLTYGLTYPQMAERARGVRSQAWFHTQINKAPGTNGPPVGEDVWEGLAHLLDISVERVRELIAEEWLGVRQRKVSSRVSGIQSSINRLEEDDFKLVVQLANRLSAPRNEAMKPMLLGD